MLVRTHPLSALLLVGALLLTGCSSEEPEPKIAKEPSVAPTQAKEETAEEFIRRWNDEQREMQKGDTSGYRAIAGECEPCISTADKIDVLYAAGGFIKTDGRTIVAITRVRDADGSVFKVAVESAPTEFKESADSDIQRFAGGPATFRVYVAKSANGWSIKHYTTVPS